MSINAQAEQSGRKERWKWVVGYEGFYLVSDAGRVMSTPSKTYYGHILKQKESKSGYMDVDLSMHGVSKNHRVHRLVAKAYIKNPHNKPEVNHKNGVKSDNRVQNLEWMTRSENERHAYRVLGKKPTKAWAGKPRKFARRFNDAQVRSIREDNRPSRVIAEEYGVSKTAIRDIRIKKNYTEVI